MLDIENEVFDPIATAVQTQFHGSLVTSEYVRMPSAFPHVTIVEADNYMSPNRLDSSNREKYSTVMYEVNVYSNKRTGKKEECREILSLIDEMMYDRNFVRTSVSTVPNMEDATIYRMVARYRAETDGERMFRV